MNFDENFADFGCGLEEENLMSKNAAAFLKSYARTCSVLTKVADLEGSQKKELIRKYLDFCYTAQDGGDLKAKNVVDIVFDKGFECITSSKLPRFKNDSRNSLHLVEFFTHCCINCIHSIEDVREVHEEVQAGFQDTLEQCSNGFKGMRVLSVHSPKFPREKDLESIKAFCKRMKMDHSDVVNDPNCILWNDLGVTCWPTLLILGPNPEGSGSNLLFTLMGEGHKDELLLIINTAMEYFCSSTMLMHDLGQASLVEDMIVDSVASNVPSNSTAFLRFPGKIAKYGDQFVVSDSGNNRLVVLDESGHVQRIIGGPQRGNVDGTLSDATFNNPQGIAFTNKFVFYVADTGNHSIRKVDLQLNQVSSLVSTGSKTQVSDESVVLKSPWDLAFYNSEILIIAAAGNHRLFGYFFSDSNLFGVEHKANTFSVVAGSGREENRNNSYILKASFAQPSGIEIITDDHDDKAVYIADSESSSIRSVTPKAQVVGVVGGSRDPTDLFAFGDTDGKGVNAKLQHPMGVCSGRNPAELFIADTYNHKIKKINLESKECITFISNGLNEPSGICADSSGAFLYVADTNNHSIKIVDVENANLSQMTILPPENINIPNINYKAEKFDKEFHISGYRSGLKLNVSLSPLPEGFEGGRWKVIPDPTINSAPKSGEVEKLSDKNDGVFSFDVTVGQNMGSFVLFVVIDIFFCSANSCLKRTRKIKIVYESDSGEEINEKSIAWTDMSWD